MDLHSFWNILEHSGTFWNILKHSARILEHSACILECSGTLWNNLHISMLYFWVFLLPGWLGNTLALQMRGYLSYYL